MLIRSIQLEDLDYIQEIEKDLFKDSSWSKEDFINEITNNVFAKYIVLEKQSKVIGYLGYWLIDDQCQITTIGVEKNFQGNRYSYLLLDYSIKEALNHGCNRITLEVRISNEIAINLYKKYNFEIVALRKNYYANGEDAYLMLKILEVDV
jgi:ribosomal-protein-alanine acetyltransferase